MQIQSLPSLWPKIMNKTIPHMCAVLALSLGGFQAHAETIEIANPSFEQRPVEPTDEQGGYYVGEAGAGLPNNLEGWSFPQWANIRVARNADGGGESLVTGGEGQQFLLLYPWVETAEGQVDGSQIWQVLSESVQPGVYKLTVSTGYAGSLWHVKADARFSLEAFNGESQNPVYTKLGECVVDLPQRWQMKEQPKDLLEDFFLTVEVPPDSPLIGQRLAVRLSANRNGDTDDNVAFDHVRLEFEPSR